MTGILLFALAALQATVDIGAAVVVAADDPDARAALVRELRAVRLGAVEASAADAHAALWSVTLDRSPPRITVGQRARPGGRFRVTDTIAVVGGDEESLRRALIRAAEILRARVAATAGRRPSRPPAEDRTVVEDAPALAPLPSPEPSPPTSLEGDAEPSPAPPPETPAASASRPEPARRAPLPSRVAVVALPRPLRQPWLALGAGAGLIGSSGGLGAFPLASVTARLTPEAPLSLFFRPALSIGERRLVEREGESALGVLAFMAGADWQPGGARWRALLGPDLLVGRLATSGRADQPYEAHDSAVVFLATGAHTGVAVRIHARVWLRAMAQLSFLAIRPLVTFGSRTVAQWERWIVGGGADLEFLF